jgi:hypothetical protein
MVTKHLALLAAGTLVLSACQNQPDSGDVAAARSSLSDITHEPLGKAEIREERGQLFATNMRTPEDGVRSLYQPGVSWEAGLDWADHTTSSLSLDRVGKDQWTVDATFVAPSYAINVYDDDRQVGTIRQDQGGQQEAIFWIPWWWWWWFFDFHVYARVDTGQQQCSWELQSGQIEVRAGDTVLRGNRVEIIEDAHESYGGFDEIQVKGNGDVTYLSEAVGLE